MFKKIMVIAGIIFSANAFAQAEKFAGASVGLNTGFNKESININTVTNYAQTDNTPSNINASYTFAVSPSMTLAVGMNYDLTTSTVIPSSQTGDTDYQLKNHYSVNIEPGYAFSESTLGYVKLAYHNAKGYYSSSSVDQSATGTGYGFGAKYLLSENLFLNFEFQTIKYNSYTVSTYSIEHKTQLTTFGIGYKF